MPIDINSCICEASETLGLGIVKNEDTKLLFQSNEYEKCSSSGVFNTLVFTLTIKNASCELSIRPIKINIYNYIINSSLRGIESKGKPEVRVLQLNTKEFIKKQTDSSIVKYKRESIILRIKHALLLPLFQIQSLQFMNLPHQILIHILTFVNVRSIHY